MPTAFGSRFAAQRAELLKRVANIGIFQILNDDERHELLVHGVMHNFNDDEIIFEEGSLEDRSIYFIVSGEIEVQLGGYDKDGSNTVATLAVGDIMGEMSMFNNQPRSATTKSKGHSTLLQLDFHKLLHHPSSNPSPNLTIKILTHIAESLSDKISNMNTVLMHMASGYPSDLRSNEHFSSHI